jgi:hypothetical protein
LSSTRTRSKDTGWCTVEIREIQFHRVAIPGICPTRVAPIGGHEGNKVGSEYLLLDLMADGGVVGLGEISDIESSWGTVA